MTKPIRVPAGMTSPRKTLQGWESRVSIPQDEDGFFGRECPARDCLAYFKLHGGEYETALQGGVLSCPECGVRQDHQTFMTPGQVKRSEAAMRELAHGAMQNALAEAFGGLSRSRRSGAVTIRYTPGLTRIPNPLPTYVEQQTVRTFTCPNGRHRAVIYDLLTVCPYCGPDTPPRAVLDDHLAGVGRALGLAEHVPDEHRREVEAAGGVTTLAERALGGAVAAVQTFAKQLHAKSDKPTTSRNPWQSVTRLQEQWQTSFSSNPLAALSADDVRLLRVGFARRHLLEHNGGVADERYVQESGDNIAIGRRIRVKPAFVREFLEAVVRLADALQTPNGASDSDPFRRRRPSSTASTDEV